MFNTISDFVDVTLNRVFSLSHATAGTRFRILVVGFVLVWILMTVNIVGIDTFRMLAIAIQTSILENDAAGTLNNITTAFLYTFFTPVVLRHILTLFAPFWLMQHVAAAYLADIFEKDHKVAGKFISQAAFGLMYNTIHIREGKIVEADLASPVVQIGGPGNVVVELDSAVLFERPDGSYHIISPTNNGSLVVTAFERVRAIIDLRDVNEGQTVTARSKDGIPVIARDIQYSFSIYRGPEPVKKDRKTPYPFDQDSILTLVYKNPKPVKPGETTTYKADWISPLPGKIAGQIAGDVSGFVGRLTLSQFLSNIGLPEQANIDMLEKKIDQESQRISEQSSRQVLDPTPVRESFTARTEMTAALYENFKKRAAQKGVYLNWIGVGTWDTPAEIIPAKHMQAWQLSRENFVRGNADELNRVQNEAKLQELLRFLREMLTGKFFDNLEKTPIDEKIDVLLQDFLELLKNAREKYRRDGEIPEDLSNAIEIISRFYDPPHHRI
jgi:hypothetical protein